MDAHTVGPWEVAGQANTARYIVVRAPAHRQGRGRIVAKVPFNTEHDLGASVCTDAADANLIAAAPDLYVALNALLHATMFKDHPVESQLAKNALAKAEGRA